MAGQQSQVHGTLHATIYEVDRLYTTGGPWNFIQKLSKSIMGARVSQVYVTIDLGNVGVGRTSKLDSQDSNPRWYQTFHIYCAHEASHLVFSLKQDNPIGATVIGRAHLPIQKLREEAELDAWLDLLPDGRTPVSGAPPKLHVKLHFLDATQEPNWSQGIKTPNFPGVPHTFFPQRKGCRVVLYQDAHVPNKFIPEIPLSGGKFYEPNQCWEDMFHAISNAKHLIYITGWSVYTKIALVRHSRGELSEEKKKTLPLGELLKKKASEGVRVLLLLWEDRTSVKLLRKDGLMSTHGEDTWKYFYGSGVHCVLCPRNPDNGLTIVQDIEVSTMFTHHQKSVVVDCELPNGGSERRRISGFIGGFDLCDGRYDTPTHSIFRTLDTVHRDDFRQANFPNASLTKGGPREPWHDVHCRLEGPIAWDILFNFEQRWRKQGGKDALVDLRELDGVVIPPSPVMFPEDPESWNVQLFRSIDGGAAFGFPDSPEDAARAGLVRGNDHVIDRSVQDAYINAIRRAKSFIYIENQYFLGSSFCWSSDDLKVEDVGASHLVPKELSLKIVSKIEAGERFSAYVVIPMWPEGVPESSCAQVILNWQKRTMKSMYADIAQALSAKGLQANPKDYLSFFCLGNREKKRHGEYEPPERPDHDTNYHRAQQSRRFMIYVHAKLMIVDDEYIITGSANINQRSMDGARDSEIAMGAYQPYHLASERPARGQIHGFRMALWFEHLGLINDDSFLSPESLDCVRKVNQLAERNWKLYTCERMDHDLPGHLLSYPIRVTDTGDVAVLPGSEFFPDTKAPVMGSKSEYIPPMLTT